MKCIFQTSFELRKNGNGCKLNFRILRQKGKKSRKMSKIAFLNFVRYFSTKSGTDFATIRNMYEENKLASSKLR